MSKAVLEGGIKLEDDVRLYLKGDYSNLEYNNTPIKVKNLLTHTSGLPKLLLVLCVLVKPYRFSSGAFSFTNLVA